MKKKTSKSLKMFNRIKENAFKQFEKKENKQFIENAFKQFEKKENKQFIENAFISNSESINTDIISGKIKKNDTKKIYISIMYMFLYIVYFILVLILFAYFVQSITPIL